MWLECESFQKRREWVAAVRATQHKSEEDGPLVERPEGDVPMW